MLAVFVKSDKILRLQVFPDNRQAYKVNSQLIWQSCVGEILHPEPINSIIEVDGNIDVWSWALDEIKNRGGEGFFYVCKISKCSR